MDLSMEEVNYSKCYGIVHRLPFRHKKHIPLDVRSAGQFWYTAEFLPGIALG